MSDFDSNPFADPDINNPFKVSVVPKHLPPPRRLVVSENRQVPWSPLRPPLGSSQPLLRHTWGRRTPFGGRAPGPASLVWGSDRNIRSSASGRPSPRPRLRRVVPWHRSGPTRRGGFLARPLGAGRGRHLGRWSCQLPGKCGWSGRGRDWEAVEEGSPFGGVVVGTPGGGEVLRGVMAEVGAQSKLQLKKCFYFIFIY